MLTIYAGVALVVLLFIALASYELRSYDAWLRKEEERRAKNKTLNQIRRITPLP